jgi:hypothetical protein
MRVCIISWALSLSVALRNNKIRILMCSETLIKMINFSYIDIFLIYYIVLTIGFIDKIPDEKYVKFSFEYQTFFRCLFLIYEKRR